MLQKSDAMAIRNAALILGLLHLIIGLAGFIPGLTFVPNATSGPTDFVYPGPGYGYTFSFLPTNYFHSAVGLLIGLWGIAGFTSLGGAIAFNQAFAIIGAAQAIMGIIPGLNTVFGLMPLYGGNVLMSLLAAGVAYYYGFVKPGSIAKGAGLSSNL
jgi:Domain of unknown function (DUF4383)